MQKDRKSQDLVHVQRVQVEVPAENGQKRRGVKAEVTVEEKARVVVGAEVENTVVVKAGSVGVVAEEEVEVGEEVRVGNAVEVDDEVKVGERVEVEVGVGDEKAGVESAVAREVIARAVEVRVKIR